MPAVAAGAAIVGAGVAIYGAISSANDQAQLDQERATVAGEQSAEIGAREQANEAMRNQTAYRQKLQFGASYAASGKAGVGIGSQLQIQNQADLQNMISNREATFQQTMLAQQAGVDTTLGAETQAAGTTQAIGLGIAGLAKGASAAYGTGSGSAGPTQGLGAYPGMPSTTLTMPSLGSSAGYSGGGS